MTRNADPEVYASKKGSKMTKNVQMRAGWDLMPPMDRKFSAESGSGLGLAYFGPKKAQMGPARTPPGEPIVWVPLYMGPLKEGP